MDENEAVYWLQSLFTIGFVTGVFALISLAVRKDIARHLPNQDKSTLRALIHVFGVVAIIAFFLSFAGAGVSLFHLIAGVSLIARSIVKYSLSRVEQEEGVERNVELLNERIADDERAEWRKRQAAVEAGAASREAAREANAEDRDILLPKVPTPQPARDTPGLGEPEPVVREAPELIATDPRDLRLLLQHLVEASAEDEEVPAEAPVPLPPSAPEPEEEAEPEQAEAQASAAIERPAPVEALPEPSELEAEAPPELAPRFNLSRDLTKPESIRYEPGPADIGGQRTRQREDAGPRPIARRMSYTPPLREKSPLTPVPRESGASNAED